LAHDAQPIRAAVFASGNGSNAENILRVAARHPGRIDIPFVICDKPGAYVIERAAALDVPCHVIPVEREIYDTYSEAKAEQEDDILEILASNGIEWVFLAGYMQIITPHFLSFFADEKLGVNRVVNIHPSLLPAFPGRDGYGDAWAAGVKQSGVTLHYVDDGIDTGPIIAQKTFNRLDTDSFDDFKARGLQLEYKIYEEFIEKLAGEKP
jgi:phosphoribosylglycinamide formyltransferase 1